MAAPLQPLPHAGSDCPEATASPAEAWSNLQLYDRLFDTGADLKLKSGLALSAEPNAGATMWTFTLRDGVEFHNGKPFGADDVLYTIRSWADKESRTYGSLNGVIDYTACASAAR